MTGGAARRRPEDGRARRAHTTLHSRSRGTKWWWRRLGRRRRRCEQELHKSTQRRNPNEPAGPMRKGRTAEIWSGSETAHAHTRAAESSTFFELDWRRRRKRRSPWIGRKKKLFVQGVTLYKVKRRRRRSPIQRETRMECRLIFHANVLSIDFWANEEETSPIDKWLFFSPSNWAQTTRSFQISRSSLASSWLKKRYFFLFFLTHFTRYVSRVCIYTASLQSLS